MPDNKSNIDNKIATNSLDANGPIVNEWRSNHVDSDSEGAAALVSGLSIDQTTGESDSGPLVAAEAGGQSSRTSDASKVVTFLSKDVRLVLNEAKLGQKTQQSGHRRVTARGKRATGSQRKRRRLEAKLSSTTSTTPSGQRPGLSKSNSALKPSGSAIANPVADARSVEGLSSSTKKRPRKLDSSLSSPDASTPKRRVTGSSSKAPSEPGSSRAGDIPVSNPLSFRKSLLDELMVVITDSSCPEGKYSTDQADVIFEAIDDELDQAMSRPEYTPILFGNRRFFEGLIRVHCSDLRAVEWLRDKVSTFKNKEGNAVLKVIRESNLPKLLRMTIWIKGKVLTKETILLRLRAQNPHLKVDRWCFYHHLPKPESNGQLAVFGIPEDTVAILEQQEFFAYFGMCTVRFKGSIHVAEVQPSNGPN